MQIAHTGSRHLLAFRNSRGVSEQNVVMDVALRLPDVGRMRLADVDHVERHSFFVLLVQLVERGNLPAKWRSSVTAEDEYDGFAAA